VAAAQSGQLV